MDGIEDLANEPFNLIRLENLRLPEPERFRFQYTELEFSYALTPYIINHLLGVGYDGVLFLKQETLVLGALGPVVSAPPWRELTPHILEPPTRPDALTWEINVLRAGIFNGGFIAFANCEKSRHFLAWWQERTFRECIRETGWRNRRWPRGKVLERLRRAIEWVDPGWRFSRPSRVIIFMDKFRLA